MIEKRRIFFLIFISFFSICLFSQQIQFGETGPYKKLTEGPYIFWEEGKAIVKYLWNGNYISEEVVVKEHGDFTVSLGGFDSEFEISSFPPTIDPTIYTNVPKIFVVSDIHGQYNRFVEILRGNGILDRNMEWNWGNGHLVIIGDVFDRGNQVTECLWLIHRLEREAEQWKGKVHFLLGNHEIMVLQGNTRYVHDKYTKVAEIMEMDVPSLYSDTSELGRWLRSKNTIEVINNILFVHAGIHPHFTELNHTIEEINNRIRVNIDSPQEKIKYNDLLNFIFGSIGPFWYRGYFMDTEDEKQIEQHILFETLIYMNVTEVVVGHTTQDFINPFFKDKVIPVDTGIQYGNKGEALLWKDGIFYRAKVDGYIEQLTFPVIKIQKQIKENQ